jgi:hypothetical protein
VYQSTFVRYERRGDRVVPVRVTKQWVSFEKKPIDNRKEPEVTRRFTCSRIQEVRWTKLTDREQAPEAWVSSSRVESRERILGLGNVLPAGACQPTLDLDDASKWSLAQVEAPLDLEPGTREHALRMQWATLRGVVDEVEPAAVAA